jgi:glycosyltransferase involved in cell wall biosynthesis
MTVFPGGADAFANDVIAMTAQRWRADVVITLKDIHVFRPDALRGLRWCPMVPVDHEPAPSVVTEIARQAYRPIAYAPNGVRALRAAGLDPLYAPHGYDPAVMRPGDQAAARAALGFPDGFLVGTVAVNRGGYPSRKAWPQNLEGFALFAQQRPDARYYLHTDIADDGYEAGAHLRSLCAKYGIADKVFFCDQARYRRGEYADEELATIYQALDVVNAVSLGEGFGIPTLEAQACGTPVIVGRWAAQADLAWGGWGLLPEHALSYESQQGACQFIPQPPHIAAALEAAYRAKADGTIGQIAAQAVAGAQPHAVETVIREHWLPLFDALRAQIANEHRRGVIRIVHPREVFYA